jgi:hypothetical protein
MQVMREWIERLNDRKSFSYSPGDRLSRDHVSGDPVAINLLNHVHAREAESKQLALKDLNQFDRKQWSGSGRGPCRGARARPLEKWTAAHRHGRSSHARRQQLDEQVPYCLRLVLSNFADQSVRTLESPRSLHFHFPVVICTRPDN